MRKYCVLFTLCAPFYLHSQQFAVMLEKMNVLYRGISNQLSVMVSDVPPNRLLLIPSQGELTKTDSTGIHYSWTICKGFNWKASLILADSTTVNPIDTLFFRVRAPEPNLKDLHRNVQTPMGIVRLFEKYCLEDWPGKVLEFKVLISSGGNTPQFFESENGQLTEEALANIRKTQPGDTLKF